MVFEGTLGPGPRGLMSLCLRPSCYGLKGGKVDRTGLCLDGLRDRPAAGEPSPASRAPFQGKRPPRRDGRQGQATLWGPTSAPEPAGCLTFMVGSCQGSRSRRDIWTALGEGG